MAQQDALGIVYDEIGPEYVIEVYDPKLKFRGVAVLDNLNLGIAKGGIRMTGTVNPVEVSRLARAMSYKNAMAGLPFGGGKSGIMVDPKGMSLAKKKAIIESFAKMLRPFVPKYYIAGPDINTTEREMAWFADSHGEWESVTGKPATYTTKKNGKTKRGLPHELGSTGFGVALSAKVAMEHLEMSLKGAEVTIAGYGNVGVFAHKFLEEWGAKIVAVSDSSGTIYDRNGLEYKKLLAAKTKKGSVLEYPATATSKKLSRDVIYELSADVMIPAAGPDVINDSNIERIKAKVIVEGANIPMREHFEKTLHKKSVLIIPDFVANAGGVISSYAEYMGYDAEKMFKLVESKIVPNVKEMLATAKKTGNTPRETAIKIAKKRILAAKSPFKK
jgi:glutamate dehydrogenase/leucine dehydrogenase